VWNSNSWGWLDGELYQVAQMFTRLGELLGDPREEVQDAKVLRIV
jgi:hypothetical protein